MQKQGQVYTLMKEYGKRKDDSSSAAALTVETVLGCDPHAPKSPLSPLPKSPLIGKDGAAEKIKPNASLIQKEESATGAVSWDVYKGYMNSCGLKNVSIYLCLAMMTQLIAVGQNVFLADWASSNDKLGDGETNSNTQIMFRLGIYGIFYLILM
jgi:hypothetical protein